MTSSNNGVPVIHVATEAQVHAKARRDGTVQGRGLEWEREQDSSG